MNNNSNKNISGTLTVISGLLLVLFLIIVSGLYEPQGETFSPFNVMIFSAAGAFVLSLVAVCLQKSRVSAWLIFILSLILIIAIIWFLASFRFKL